MNDIKKRNLRRNNWQALIQSKPPRNRTSAIPAWFTFHIFMRLIFTNIIMQHTSHFKWLHRHSSVAQGPSHCHHGDSRTPLWHRRNRAQRKSVTLRLRPNFHSVSVMFLEWNCLSGLAPLKPIIVLRPGRGWPVGLTCHSSCLTHSPKPHMSKTANRISLLGCRHSSLAPEAGCYDSKAYPRCWKWHWQIITRQCIWQCQHIWLAHISIPVGTSCWFD